MTIRPKAYCILCNERNEYTIESEPDDLEIRGVSFSYQKLIARCKKCGCWVYVPAVNDNNVTARHKAYYDALYSMEEKKHG